MQLEARAFLENKRKDKEIEQAMRVVEFAKNILVAYCRNPTILSCSVVEIVDKKLKQNPFDTPISTINKFMGSFPSKMTEIPEIERKIENLQRKRVRSESSPDILSHTSCQSP